MTVFASGAFEYSAVLEFLGHWLLYFLLPWVLLLPLGNHYLFRVSLRHSVHRSMRFAVGLLLLGVLHACLALLLLRLVGVVTEAPPPYVAELYRLMIGNAWLLIDALLFVLLAVRADNVLLRECIRQQGDDAFRLGRHLTTSKLQTLKMQLNPHFLFNTLNGLAVLIDKRDNERAREMLGELSSFLRQTLRSPTERWVTLEKELEFVRQYLKIEQYRFGERLSYFEECEPLALTAHIPPLLLQPLFENAIVHGLADKEGDCRLAFECRLYDRWLHMRIFDNGDSFDAAQLVSPTGGGIGLANVQARLREAYGDNSSLQIDKKPDGTLVTLKIPAYKDSEF